MSDEIIEKYIEKIEQNFSILEENISIIGENEKLIQQNKEKLLHIQAIEDNVKNTLGQNKLLRIKIKNRLNN